jgi:aryl-alcohol dehydrogenase-like predicted oxidoreductase
MISKRPLGKTGKQLSIIGFGGLVVANTKPLAAASIVAEAVSKGINYFDVAPSYIDAEIRLGPALKSFRSNCFLACKTGKRDKAGAKEELDNSLKNLKTDHLDLYQLHAINDIETDVKAALSKDGAIQTFLEAKKHGIINFIGFSSHSPQAALFAMREFDFDTILFPVNFCCHFQAGLEQEVLAEAKKRNMGILALKSMAKQKWQNDEDCKAYPKCWYEPVLQPEMASLALRWTLSQDITAALPPGEEPLFKIALEIASAYKKLSSDELSILEKFSVGLQHIFSA